MQSYRCDVACKSQLFLLHILIKIFLICRNDHFWFQLNSYMVLDEGRRLKVAVEIFNSDKVVQRSYCGKINMKVKCVEQEKVDT